MDFQLTSEQRMIRDLARSFAEREIVPVAARYDRAMDFPTEVFQQALKLGLLNLTIPAPYGGGGLGILNWPWSPNNWPGATGIGGAIGLNAARPTPRRSAAPRPRNRNIRSAVWANLVEVATEPNAGSDVAAFKRARRATERQVHHQRLEDLDLNATVASFAVVFARTDVSAGHRGLSTFLVEMNSPGVEVSRKLEKMGQRASPAAEINLVDVEVPAENLLGEEGSGFLIAMKVFDRSRPMIAASAVGLTSRCLDEALKYARERKTMGRPIIEHQAIGHKLADMAMRLEAARLLTYQASWLHDAGQRNTLQAAYAKAFAADTATWASSEAVQIHGGMGYSTEFIVEKLYRDAKVLQIYEGTSEIQRNIIVRELTR